MLPLTLSAAAVIAFGQTETDTSHWKQTPDGIVFNKDDPNAKIAPYVAGATFLKKYESYKPRAIADQNRDKNRAVIKQFFDMPIGEAAARLYTGDGVKQLPSMGIEWRGVPNLIKNNDQNSKLFASWKWTDIVVWDTQDPSVFWVECQGGQHQEGGGGTFGSHYLLQFVIKDAKIEIMKEFTTPFARGLE
jgi:hypothetical protein